MVELQGDVLVVVEVAVVELELAEQEELQSHWQ